MAERTDEERRALAYRESLRRRAAWQRANAIRLRGDEAAARGLYERTRAAARTWRRDP